MLLIKLIEQCSIINSILEHNFRAEDRRLRRLDHRCISFLNFVIPKPSLVFPRSPAALGNIIIVGYKRHIMHHTLDGTANAMQWIKAWIFVSSASEP